MKEILEYIPVPDMVILLTACSILGTGYAYMQKWAWSKDREVGLRSYLFGDSRAVARSLTKLVGALAVTITVDMTSGMDVTGVIILGFGIGLAVPEQVEQQQKELNGINEVVTQEDGTPGQSIGRSDSQG